jgi:hypothetical protein
MRTGSEKRKCLCNFGNTAADTECRRNPVAGFAFADQVGFFLRLSFHILTTPRWPGTLLFVSGIFRSV